MRLIHLFLCLFIAFDRVLTQIDVPIESLLDAVDESDDDMEEAKKELKKLDSDGNDDELPDEKSTIEFARDCNKVNETDNKEICMMVQKWSTRVHKEVVKRKAECAQLDLQLLSQRRSKRTLNRFGMAFDRNVSLAAHCRLRQMRQKTLTQRKKNERKRLQKLKGLISDQDLKYFADARLNARKIEQDTAAVLSAARAKLRELVGLNTVDQSMIEAQRKVVAKTQQDHRETVKMWQETVKEHNMAKVRYAELHPKAGTATVPCMYKGVLLTKAIRKEYHTLTNVERNRYHAALKALKANGVYDTFAQFHYKAAFAVNAHNGPAFLLWHRELLKRYELELRKVDPLVALPFWNSNVNNYNPLSNGSAWASKWQITFTPDFMGNPSGKVRTGPAAGWLNVNQSSSLVRNVGTRFGFIVDTTIQLIMTYATDYTYIFRVPAAYSGCKVAWFQSWEPSLEIYHGYGHLGVGGDMSDTPTASADPLFFMHHCLYDQIWEAWRQKWQSPEERETQYPTDDVIEGCASSTHTADSILEPFTNLNVMDALSNLYTQELFQYAVSPICSAKNRKQCGSPYLFCSLSPAAFWSPGPKCMAKIIPGGPCAIFTRGEDVCYQGTCKNGVCVKNAA
ncbi:unnamed protein product, partial [Mesorhabditis belari]|uniref:Tyrosinase copper-binding domain-containing protein n=1 Tax=Mesorhabditis belari TaxID=2138241 RepID=A0AAF3EDW5_9BILA